MCDSTLHCIAKGLVEGSIPRIHRNGVRRIAMHLLGQQALFPVKVRSATTVR